MWLQASSEKLLLWLLLLRELTIRVWLVPLVSLDHVFTPLFSLLLTVCLCLVLIHGISGLGFWFGLENKGVCHTSLMT